MDVNPCLLVPKPVRPGATIGIISPSSPGHLFLKEQFDQAIEALKKFGWKIKLGSHIRSHADPTSFSESVKSRANELEEFFENEEVDLIMATIGGDTAIEILPLLNFTKIKKKPKAICGYSDISILQLAVLSKIGLGSYYGPNLITSFGEAPQPHEVTVDYFSKAILGQENIYLKPPSNWSREYVDSRIPGWKSRCRPYLTHHGWKILRKGNGAGYCLGANLSSLLKLSNTEFFPDLKEKLLFLDQRRFDPLKFNTDINKLKNLGIFENLQALIISKPEIGSVADCQICENIVYKATRNSSKSYPVIMNFDCGHTHPMFTIPTGAMGSIRTDDVVNIFLRIH